MIKASRFHHSSVKTALYYVRIQTYSGLALFDSDCRPTSEQQCSPSELQHDLANASPSLLPQQSLTSAAFVLTQIAAEELAIASQYQDISVDRWAIFPNSLHALITMKDQSPDSYTNPRKPRSLTLFIARFKAATAKRINLVRNQPGAPVWQRSYKEQIIQDEMTLSRLSRQIIDAEDAIASGGTLIHQ